MSSDALLLGLFLIILWAIGIAWFSGSRFAFVLWFPFLATSLLFSISGIYKATKLRVLRDDTSIYGLALVQVFLVLAVALVMVGWCAVTRPGRQPYSKKVVVPTVIGYLALIGVWYGISRHR